MNNPHWLIASIILALVGVAVLSETIGNLSPAGLVSGHALATAVRTTNTDRFPGEGELMKTINSQLIRGWLDLWSRRGSYDPSGLGYLNPPVYYGEHDVLQILQEKGINVSDLRDAEMEAYLQEMYPDLMKRIDKLR